MSSTIDTPMSDVASPFVLSELNAEAFVTLTVGESQTPFVLLKSLLCLRSEYFRALFNGNFQESVSHTSSLPDIDPPIFSLVVQWLHTDRVVFSNGTDALPLDLASQNTFFEAIKLFIFADQYDTRSLRLAVFDKIASVFATSPGIKAAGLIATAQAITMLPEHSGLRRLLLDRLIWNWEPKSAEQAADVLRHLPWEIVGVLVFEDRGAHGNPVRQRRETEPWERDMCQYHEHVNERERKECAGVMEVRAQKMEADLAAVKRMTRRRSSRGDVSV